MPTYAEPIRPLEFLYSEANGQLSRESVVIAANSGALAAGRVLGRLAAGTFQAYDNASGTANLNVAAAVLAYPVLDSASPQNVAVIARDAEVKAAALGWGGNDGAGITAGRADLAAVGIIVRD